jgi:hypothetical protein
MTDVGMPMPALFFSMPMPTYTPKFLTKNVQLDLHASTSSVLNEFAMEKRESAEDFSPRELPTVTRANFFSARE